VSDDPIMFGDRYETMGPDMRARLDRAEDQLGRLDTWLGLLADRDLAGNLIAREIVLLLGRHQYFLTRVSSASGSGR
jgi:hypothetical protein